MTELSRSLPSAGPAFSSDRTAGTPSWFGGKGQRLTLGPLRAQLSMADAAGGVTGLADWLQVRDSESTEGRASRASCAHAAGRAPARGLAMPPTVPT